MAHDEEKHIHRVENGHEEDFNETYHEYDDEGNPIEEEDDTAEEKGYSHETPEERADREAQDDAEDTRTAALNEKRAYEERKAREKIKRDRAKEHAAASERVARGSLEKDHTPAQSKRLLNWVVDLKKERAAQELAWFDRPYTSDKDNPLISQADVDRAKTRLEKTKKSRDDTVKERRNLQREIKQLQTAKSPSTDYSGISREDRIAQRKRRLTDAETALENQNKQVRDLEVQLDEVTKVAGIVSGRTGQGGTIPPPGPTLHGEDARKRPAPKFKYDADGKKVLIPELPEDARKKDVIRHEVLRKKMLKAPTGGRGGLNKKEQVEFDQLEHKLSSYRIIAKPNHEGDLAEPEARKKTKEKLEETYPVEFVPKPETIEETLTDYGQENPHPGLWSTYRTRQGKESHDVLGWRSTYDFNKEQAKRKYGALSTGEFATGFGKPTEKAKYTFSPNQDWIIKSDDWEPRNELEANQGQDKFTVTVKNTGKEPVAESTGKVYETGFTVGDTVRDLGLSLHVNAGKKPNEFTITTDQGEHLNPDQINALQESLHVFHGMDKNDFKASDTIGFNRVEKRVPVGYSKLPKGLKPEEAIQQRKTIYNSRVGARFGQRNAETNELLEGERDSVGLTVGGRTLQRHFNEDSDAVGWGTSWRPGEKEKSDFLLAIPRHRLRQKKEMSEAWKKSLETKNDEPIQDYIHKYYPNADQAEVEEHKSHIKTEGAALASAFAAGGYYSAKRDVPRRVGNSLWRGFQRIPGVGPRAYNAAEDAGFTKERGNLWHDVDWAYRRPLSGKINRAIFRVKRPLTSGSINAETGKIDFDETVPGVMFHNEFKPHLPSWHYRKHINMPPGRRLGRELERKVLALKGEVNTTLLADKVLRGETKVNRAESWLRLQQARTLLHDPARRNQSLEERLVALRTNIEGKLNPTSEFELYGKRHNTTIEKEPELKALLIKHKKELDNQLRIVQGEGKHAFNRTFLKSDIESYLAAHPNKLPRYMWKGGLYGTGLVAAAGLGTLAVDRYQTYRHNQGENIRHPILEALPETISVPKLKVTKTRQLALPNNTFTRALDLEHEKLPVAARISLVRDQKLRMHNFTDVSGEKFKRGMPLLGGIDVGAPAPVEGSLKKAILPKAMPSEIGPTKNMYVRNHKLPVDIAVGKKERWDNKSHKLRAKYNRYKLDQEDMEKLAVLSTSEPDQVTGRMSRTPTLTSEGERYRDFYANNAKFQEMLTDPNELTRLHKKHSGWAYKEDKDKAETSFGMGQNLEEAQATRRAHTRARREYQRQTKPR